jgi:hypothetical protein
MPSVVIPEERNLLLNPEHPAFKWRVQILGPEIFEWGSQTVPLIRAPDGRSTLADYSRFSASLEFCPDDAKREPTRHDLDGPRAILKMQIEIERSRGHLLTHDRNYRFRFQAESRPGDPACRDTNCDPDGGINQSQDRLAPSTVGIDGRDNHNHSGSNARRDRVVGSSNHRDCNAADSN